MERDLDRHLPVLAWCHILMGGMVILVGMLLIVLLSGIGLASGEALVLSTVGFSVGIFLFFLGAPGVAAGYGLLGRRSWARPLALAIGFLQLMNVPLGTALGAYTIWVLWDEEAADAF